MSTAALLATAPLEGATCAEWSAWLSTLSDTDWCTLERRAGRIVPERLRPLWRSAVTIAPQPVVAVVVLRAAGLS